MMFTFLLLLLLLKLNMSVQKNFRDRSASSALPRGRDHSRGHWLFIQGGYISERAEDFYPPTLETTFIIFSGKQIQG